MYNTHTLPNGLRIIQRPSSSDVIYCGYAIKAGTRHEQEGEEGLAHFCEHASFKGTERRRGWQVIQTLEGVGGELNAYTNKESTVYYCATQRQHLSRAIDLLTDIVLHSAYPEAELEKEKEVVCDEIESYNDSPAELIYDRFENILFHNHPLGHNILGTKETVRNFTVQDVKRFTQRYYRPDNMVFFIFGGESITPIVKNIERQLERYPLDSARLKALECTTESADKTAECTFDGASEYKGKTMKSDDEPSHQAHVMIGCRAYDINHPRRIALYLLNNILGGPSMSSRLNMSLRERNGLVYTVDSSMTSYGDTGIWSVYFGCDHKDVKRCVRLVRNELNKLMARPMSPRQLLNAKKQIKGQIALAMDSHETFALDFGKTFLYYGKEKDVSALCRQIDALTADDLLLTARELFAPENITTYIM